MWFNSMWDGIGLLRESIYNPPNRYKYIRHRSQKKKRLINRRLGRF